MFSLVDEVKARSSTIGRNGPQEVTDRGLIALTQKLSKIQEKRNEFNQSDYEEGSFVEKKESSPKKPQQAPAERYLGEVPDPESLSRLNKYQSLVYEDLENRAAPQKTEHWETVSLDNGCPV